MAIATCGHEVEDGITLFVKGTTKDGKDCMDYVTYCDKCVMEAYENGNIRNEELSLLIKTLCEDV